MAQALFNHISGDFIQAEGVCLGDSRLQAGKKVEISGVGERFSGHYFVTQATHTYSAEIGYETAFSITGRHPNTISEALNNGHHPTQNGGVVIGLVTNNRDPEGWGRVKVKFPWLSDSEESAWARLAAPMAGQGGGFYYLPEVNDEVLLAFEHGDIHYPYVLGALWNGRDKPPGSTNQVVGGDGKVNQRILKSRSGHKILLDDSSGQEKIEIVDSRGSNSLTISTAENAITLEAFQTITIKAQAKVMVQCGPQMINADIGGVDILGGGRSIILRGGQIAIG
jgi:uncharacterized protein involved in type VI secretion and phage assembly